MHSLQASAVFRPAIESPDLWGRWELVDTQVLRPADRRERPLALAELLVRSWLSTTQSAEAVDINLAVVATVPWLQQSLFLPRLSLMVDVP